MAFKFEIGRAPADSRGFVAPCEGDPDQVHRDPWDNGDGPVRQPTYADWHEVLMSAPYLERVYDAIESYGQQADADWVPVSFYADCLDGLEAEASALEATDPWTAAREFWLVRWSRQALALYGDAAAFGCWGEWRR